MTTSTNPPTTASGWLTFTLPLTLLIGVGTGDLWLPHWALGTGASLNQYNLQVVKSRGSDRTNSVAQVTTADDIEYIKASLRLTVTDLAKYLGVSRQAIYDWRAGGHVKSHNISKLENLRTAAGVISESGNALSSSQINRKLPGGRTLLDTIAIGGDGYEAAHSLTSMLQREAQQQKTLRDRFAGRKPLVDSEFAPAMAALRESS